METTDFLTLPNELLRKLADYLGPIDAARLSQTCKRMNIIIGDQKLWRDYFFRAYKTFPNITEIATAVRTPLAEEDWRKRVADRKTRDRTTRAAFEHLLVQERSRYDNIAELVEAVGVECEDVLEPDQNALDGLEDILSRRYWASRVINHSRRRWAVEKWSVKSEGGDIFTQLATAFDAFVPGTDFRIDKKVISICKEFRDRRPGFLEIQTADEKVVLIIDFLREHRYVGERNITQYHAVHNNFISHALNSDFENRSSMPLISNLIFFAVCTRLGIPTTLCNVPGHVYSGVWRTPQSKESLADKGYQADFYVDPWTDNVIISHEEMVERCRRITHDGPDAVRHALQPIRPYVFLQRLTHNIANSITAERQGTVESDPKYPIEHVSAAKHWCMYLTYPTQRQLAVSYFGVQLVNNPEDLILVEKIMAIDVWPYDFPGRQNQRRYSTAGRDNDITQEILAVRLANGNVRLDPLMLLVKGFRDGRNDPIKPMVRTSRIRYKMGQIFRHRRYNYIAVITGWDHKCEETDSWQTQMNIAQLSGGADQPYYHASVEDGSIRYVAEENIEIVHQPISTENIEDLGKTFKRWDPEVMQFISNMTETYPED